MIGEPRHNGPSLYASLPPVEPGKEARVLTGPRLDVGRGNEDAQPAGAAHPKVRSERPAGAAYGGITNRHPVPYRAARAQAPKGAPSRASGEKPRPLPRYNWAHYAQHDEGTRTQSSRERAPDRREIRNAVESTKARPRAIECRFPKLIQPLDRHVSERDRVREAGFGDLGSGHREHGFRRVGRDHAHTSTGEVQRVVPRAAVELEYELPRGERAVEPPPDAASQDLSEVARAKLGIVGWRELIEGSSRQSARGSCSPRASGAPVMQRLGSGPAGMAIEWDCRDSARRVQRFPGGAVAFAKRLRTVSELATLLLAH
jgi:hypothetical protein